MKQIQIQIQEVKVEKVRKLLMALNLLGVEKVLEQVHDELSLEDNPLCEELSIALEKVKKVRERLEEEAEVKMVEKVIR